MELALSNGEGESHAYNLLMHAKEAVLTILVPALVTHLRYRPPMEMRKSKGIVKVRAMRISEDGTRFREFAWAPESEASDRPTRGTITLSLHLCHFAEATVEVAPARPAPNEGTNNQSQNGEQTHPILAPPTTRPQGSKLWTWYWRDEEPRAVFQFTYATKEALQAEGIIPLMSKPSSSSLRVLIISFAYMPLPADNLAVEAAPSISTTKSESNNRGHRRLISHGSLSTFSPRDIIKRKQSISLMYRTRGLSVSSVESSTSTSSVDSDGASSTTSSIDLESDNELDEGHASNADDAAVRKLRAMDAEMGM